MRRFLQSIKKRLLAVGIIFVLIVGMGGWWYTAYHTKTPEYAVRMVQESIDEHDKDKFYQYVDVSHLLDSASNDMMDGLIQFLVPVTGDTKEAVSGLTKMFKDPIVLSLQTAVNNYIMYGTWGSKDAEGMSAVDAIVDADMIVHRIGLSSVQLQGVESIALNADNGTAVARVKVLQTEADEEFVLDVELIETENGAWQVYEITNFKDFVEELQNARQKQMKNYLEESASLMQQHDEIIAQAEQEITEIFSTGTLGNNDIRSAIKAVLETKTIPDWQARKSELEDMQIPELANTLHRLRLKICDAHIDAAVNYAKWLDDKKAATIRASDNSLKVAKTLEKEAEFLTKQIR